MPLALLLAQFTGIAQSSEFVASILVIASIAPIQIYMNEVFAPNAVRYNQRLDIRHSLEIAVAILALTGWLAYRIEADLLVVFLIVAFAQGYVWFSYLASRRVLEYQAGSIIGGRYSYVIGSIIPLVFLLVVLAYWLALQLGVHDPGFLYLLILLPNTAQYIYTRFGWMAKQKTPTYTARNIKQTNNQYKGLLLFLVAMLMAIVAQHWKIELSEVAVGFAALSIYLISPFSSMWLIHAKSKFMTRDRTALSITLFWGAPCVTMSTLLLSSNSVGFIFFLALVTQVLTFKFITDIRLKSSAEL